MTDPAVNILTVTNLYPNAEQQRHGIFVEERLSHLLATGRFKAEVVAPVPWFPFTSERFGRYGQFARVPKVAERRGITVRHPRYPVVPKVGMAMAPFLMSAGIESTVRASISRFSGPTILDGHFLYPDGVALALLATRLGMPFVLTARGSDVNLFTQYTIPRTLIRWACNRAARVITVSEALRRKLIGIGVQPDRLVTLRNGVDLTRFFTMDRNEARRSTRCGERTILAVGNLVANKNHQLIIRALAGVSNARLVIIGEGPMRESLLRIARESGVADRVRILPNMPQSDLVLYYNAADVSVLASFHEGMPNVVLESLACGTPVIATEVEGVTELLDSPVAGLIIHERTTEALGAALNQILADLPDRTRARDHASRLGWEPTIRSLAEVLEAAATH